MTFPDCVAKGFPNTLTSALKTLSSGQEHRGCLFHFIYSHSTFLLSIQRIESNELVHKTECCLLSGGLNDLLKYVIYI
eukprot:m.253943 g.253943  ORF g.253943 m.253943 type:complete len:78 (+) comp40377_c0_seq9:998-1231(+)